jgi:hypothetical protein
MSRDVKMRLSLLDEKRSKYDRLHDEYETKNAPLMCSSIHLHNRISSLLSVMKKAQGELETNFLVVREVLAQNKAFPPQSRLVTPGAGFPSIHTMDSKSQSPFASRPVSRGRSSQSKRFEAVGTVGITDYIAEDEGSGAEEADMHTEERGKGRDRGEASHKLKKENDSYLTRLLGLLEQGSTEEMDVGGVFAQLAKQYREVLEIVKEHCRYPGLAVVLEQCFKVFLTVYDVTLLRQQSILSQLAGPESASLDVLFKLPSASHRNATWQSTEERLRAKATAAGKKTGNSSKTGREGGGEDGHPMTDDLPDLIDDTTSAIYSVGLLLHKEAFKKTSADLLKENQELRGKLNRSEKALLGNAGDMLEVMGGHLSKRHNNLVSAISDFDK